VQKWDGASHLFIFFGFLHLFSWKLILPFLFGYVFSSQQNKDFLLLSLSEPKNGSFTLVAISVFILKNFVVFSKRKFVRFWNIFFSSINLTNFSKMLKNLSDFQYHKIQKQKNPGYRSVCCCHCMEYHCLAILPTSLVLFLKFTLPKPEVHISIWLFCQVDFIFFPIPLSKITKSKLPNCQVYVAIFAFPSCHSTLLFGYFTILLNCQSPLHPVDRLNELQAA